MAIARPDTQLVDALSAPIGDLIAEVGRGVAEAQQAMDKATIDQVRALAEGDDSTLALLRQIGWQPTWYHIPEASAEISVALTLTGSGQSGAGAAQSGAATRMQLVATPVDAGYANRYAYELKAASSVKFRIVPVPPSPAFEAVRVIPKVVGLPFDTARTRLEEVQLGWALPDGVDEPAGQTPVLIQTPAPGAFARVGDAVVLGF